MPDESKFQLITAVRDFALHGTRYPLRDFQCIAGHLNWALNVYPHLWPDLCALYAKTADKLFQKALLWVNRGVVERELTWVSFAMSHGPMMISHPLFSMSTAMLLPLP